MTTRAAGAARGGVLAHAAALAEGEHGDVAVRRLDEQRAERLVEVGTGAEGPDAGGAELRERVGEAGRAAVERVVVGEAGSGDADRGKRARGGGLGVVGPWLGAVVDGGLGRDRALNVDDHGIGLGQREQPLEGPAVAVGLEARLGRVGEQRVAEPEDAVRR